MHPEHATAVNIASTPPSRQCSAAITSGATVPITQWLAVRHPNAVDALAGVLVVAVQVVELISNSETGFKG
jgi:hypothetical protein